MRSEDGKHFENVVGIVDKAWDTGEEFVPNVFDCNKPLKAGDEVMVGDTMYHYHGEDSLGRSIFTRVGQLITDVLF
jgi:hypothetical protein